MIAHWLAATEACSARPRSARATFTIVASRTGAIPPATITQISLRVAGSMASPAGMAAAMAPLPLLATLCSLKPGC